MYLSCVEKGCGLHLHRGSFEVLRLCAPTLPRTSATSDWQFRAGLGTSVYLLYARVYTGLSVVNVSLAAE